MASDSEKSKPAVDLNSGPPASSKKPRVQKPSLFAQANENSDVAQSNRLGPAAGSPEVMGLKFMGMLQTSVQGLSALYPGIVPLISDLMGRIQTAVPQLAADLQNGGMGFVPMGGIPPPEPGAAMAGPPQMPMGGMPMMAPPPMAM